MKFAIISMFFLILMPNLSFGSNCKIGLTKAPLQFSPIFEDWVNQILKKAYKNAGIICTSSIFPEKRLKEAEIKGEVTASAIRLDKKYLNKFYKKYPHPVAKDVKLYFVGDQDKSKPTIAIVRGVVIQEYYTKRLKPDAELVYTSNFKSLFKMYQTGRIDGFYIFKGFLKNNLHEHEIKEIMKDAKLIKSLSFFHFVNKAFVQKNPKIFLELDKFYRSGQLDFIKFLKDRQK